MIINLLLATLGNGFCGSDAAFEGVRPAGISKGLVMRKPQGIRGMGSNLQH